MYLILYYKNLTMEQVYTLLPSILPISIIIINIPTWSTYIFFVLKKMADALF